MRFSRFMYCVRQGFKNIYRNRLFSLASIGTITCCLFLFGVFFSVLYNFQTIIRSAETSVGVTVFFNDDVTEDQILNIKSVVELREEVESVDYVSDEQAWEEFKPVWLGDNEDALENLEDENPLEGMNSLTIYLKDTSKQDELVTYLESLPEVRVVNASDTLAESFTNFSRLIGYASMTIIVILVAVAVFLISNTVTIGITARKEEIAIMKYIGAKDGFVREPFVIEGLIIGIVGAIIPLILLYFMYNKAVEYIMTRFSLLNNIIDFIPVMDVYRTLLPVGLALGAGIGFLGSFITIRKHLRA